MVTGKLGRAWVSARVVYGKVGGGGGGIEVLNYKRNSAPSLYSCLLIWDN